MMTGVIRFLRGGRSASAAEFALILPGLLFLLFGTYNLSMLVYAAVNLHSAVQGAARYAVVQRNLGATSETLGSGHDVCGAGTVCDYVRNHYVGPGLGLHVDYSASGCGHTVAAEGTYKVNYGLGAVDVPLRATACYA